MKCKELATALVCFNDGAGNLQSLVAHYEYGTNASGATILVATRYTDSEGTPVSTAGGTVTVGPCVAEQIIPDSVDREFICKRDVRPDGTFTEFYERQTTTTTFNANGTVNTVTTVVDDVETDGESAYSVTGTRSDCVDDCTGDTAQGLVNSWG